VLRAGLLIVALVLSGQASMASRDCCAERNNSTESSTATGDAGASTGKTIPPAQPKRFPSVAFVVACAPSHQADDDPIVHAGHAGISHRHQFFGNRSTSAASTDASLADATTTSCDDPLDLAAYWVPTPMGARWTRLRAYYDAGVAKPSEIVPPPTGLQVVAGNAKALQPQGTNVIAWSCARSVNASGWTPTPPRCPAGAVLRARITFPQCWDGDAKRKGTARLMDVGPTGCPPDHPTVLPRLRLLLDASGPIQSLSSGRVEGLHADFWNAWNPVRLADLVRWCIRGERPNNRKLKECRPTA
jgi:Domain of unknown function (DUF1996)